MLLVINNSWQYIWYIYLNFAITQTDDCLWVRLNLAVVMKMDRYTLFSFFLFLGQKLTIVEPSCTLKGYFTLTSCHVLTSKYSNHLLSYSAFFWILTIVHILHNMCPEIIVMSSLTQQLFNSDMINDNLQENTWCRMVFFN